MTVKKTILELFGTQMHAVISTVNFKGNPESATIGFGHTENLEIIFGTNKSTRKVKNLLVNNSVSIVVNGPEVTVQYEGIAALLNGEELSNLTKIFFTKLPSAVKYKDLPGQIYFKVTPTWIRFTDHNKTPGKVTEIQF